MSLIETELYLLGVNSYDKSIDVLCNNENGRLTRYTLTQQVCARAVRNYKTTYVYRGFYRDCSLLSLNAENNRLMDLIQRLRYAGRVDVVRNLPLMGNYNDGSCLLYGISKSGGPAGFYVELQTQGKELRMPAKKCIKFLESTVSYRGGYCVSSIFFDLAEKVGANQNNCALISRVLRDKEFNFACIV